MRRPPRQCVASTGAAKATRRAAAALAPGRLAPTPRLLGPPAGTAAACSLSVWLGTWAWFCRPHPPTGPACILLVAVEA
eukprot:81714-Pyramimonas_sp.AAC.1